VYILPSLESKSWRVRDNALFIYKTLNEMFDIDINPNSIDLDREVSNEQKSTIELAIKMLSDENLYVMRRARVVLTVGIDRADRLGCLDESQTGLIKHIIKVYRDKAIKLVAEIKKKKSRGENTKEEIKELEIYASIFIGKFFHSFTSLITNKLLNVL
jgi:hypothetical protein